MILQYLNKKGNKEKSIALKQYKKILEDSIIFLNEYDLFKYKNYNSSFEIVSILLIIYFKINTFEKKLNYKKINDYLISLFIDDLDQSLRQKGIGDMSIGKYVKFYIKKFYFRIKKFPKNYDFKNTEDLNNYMNIVYSLKENKFIDLSIRINEKYHEIKKSYLT
tara:strand:- start:379 stop:870 length:492 start_codon:yes stop_codon:yes gene_type:complete